MQRFLLNKLSLEVTVSIYEDSRLLIAQYEEDSQRPGANPRIESSVRESNGKYYIPGSTVKGCFRSRAEYIANFVNTTIGACHLFSTDIDDSSLANDLSCGSRFEIRKKGGRELTSKEVFRNACPICQTFGHNYLQSRLNFTDFYELDNSAKLKTQMHIAVDRATGGGIDGKLFKSPYLVQGSFKGRISIENFQVWQVGLLGFLLQDLDDGLIRFGHNQSSGSGRMQIDKLSGVLQEIDQKDQDDTLKGIMALSERTRRQYRPAFDQSEDLVNLEEVEWQNSGIWRKMYFDYVKADDGFSIIELPVFLSSRSQTLDYLQAFSYTQSMTRDGLQKAMHPQQEQEV